MFGMSDKLLTEDELKIIRKTMEETEAKKKKQEDLKMQKESVLDTTNGDTTNKDTTNGDTTNEDTTDVDTTKLDSTSLNKCLICLTYHKKSFINFIKTL